MSVGRPVVTICSRLEGVKRNGTGWTARCPCPSHGQGRGDRNRSLSVAVGEADRALITCHAGCSITDIMSAIGLDTKDLFPDTGAPEVPPLVGREPVAVYPYHDEKGELLFEVIRYANKRFQVRRPDGRGKWIWKMGNVRRVPYRLPAILAAVENGETVYIAEGEKDVDALTSAGVFATCNSGGAGRWRQDFAGYFRDAEIVIIADNDAIGFDHARRVKENVAAVAKSVRVVQAAHGKDAADHLAAGLGVGDFVPVQESSFSSTIGSTHGAVRLHIVRASDVVAETVGWLWHRWIPIGKLTLLAGDPGEGKSTLTCDWAAQATVGRFNGELYTVLIVTAEDGVADTVRPRLDAAMADCSRVHIVNGLTHGTGELDAITLKDPKHLKLVEEAIGDLKPGFTVIDPLSAYLGDTDSWKDSAVRSILTPLAMIAEQHRTALLGSLHVNKGSQNSKALYRVQGSIGFTGAARSVIFAGHDPDDPQSHAIQVIKSNLATMPPPLGYRIVSVGDVAGVEYTGESELTAERMTEAPGKDEPEKAAAAEALILEMLDAGPRLAVEILKAASALVISESTLRRAKLKLDVRSRPRGFHGPQEWYLI